MAAISTMVAAGVAAAGIGLSAKGFFEGQEGADTIKEGAERGTAVAVEGARAQAAAQKREIDLEFQVEAQRKKAMELDARRSIREIIRTQQKATALAVATGVNQGADAGSGVAGGIAGVMGQSGVNQLGVTQNLGIGQTIFGLNAGISQARIAMADAQARVMEGQAMIGKAQAIGQAKIQQGQAYQNLGSSFINAALPLGNIASTGVTRMLPAQPTPGATRASWGPFPRIGG